MTKPFHLQILTPKTEKPTQKKLYMNIYRIFIHNNNQTVSDPNVCQ